ncbi:MAG: porin [Phycisphaerales bacterium]|jgi:hypothetical protein|nr:porin [Phycisphaerales bacterium]
MPSGSRAIALTAAFLGVPAFASDDAPTLHALTSVWEADEAEAANAGYDGKFYIASDDGNARLNIGGVFQFRYVANFNPEDAHTGDSEFSNGFQFRRLRLNMTGTFKEAGVDFKIQAEFASGFGRLLDAVVRKSFDDGVWILVGQHEVSYTREVEAPSSKQLAIERSLAEEVFGLDRATGIALGIDRDRWRARGTLSDGRRGSNSAFYDESEADVALTARAELRLFDAPWKQFDDLTAFPDSKRGLLLGAGLHWQVDGNIPSPGVRGENDRLLQGTLDASYEDAGWNAMIAGHFRSIDADSDAVDFGLVAQAGAFLDEHNEVYTRFVQLWPDPDRDHSDPFSTIAVGTNHYFIPDSHAAKLSVEGNLLLSDTVSSSSIVFTPNVSQGILAGDEAGQFILTAQLQLVF